MSACCGVARRAASLSAVLGLAFVAVAGCTVEAGPEVPAGAYGNCLSDEFIATTEPVYFDGRPTYWCGDFWFYREGGRWRRYEREPPALYERRAHGLPERRVYEPPRRPPPSPRPRGGAPPVPRPHPPR